MQNRYIAIGAISAMLAVALGAFGAHGLEGKITNDMLKVYNTGVTYHMSHALGILLIALMVDKLGDSNKVLWAGRLLLIGTILFSGSLYLLAVTDVKQLGIITPFGGVAFLAGWLLVALAAMGKK